MERERGRVTVSPNAFLTEESLNHDRIVGVADTWREDPRVGAVVSFSGVVRGDSLGEATVRAIEFSAHREMAEQAIKELIDRLTREIDSSVVRVYLQHALGTVPVGGIPIIIVVATSHRREAFGLCSAILEALKSEVPIYGKELTDGGDHRWKENR